MRFRILGEARQEAAAAVRYCRYELEDAELAHDLAEQLDKRIEHIQRFPHGGSLVSGYPTSFKVRRFCLRRFPYTLYVAYLPDECLIAAVAHTRQRPGYWLDRLPQQGG